MFGLQSWLPRGWKTPLALLGMGAVGFALGGGHGIFDRLAAQPPSGPVVPASGTTSDYSKLPVAQIHGNIWITREDLGEFLIARHGYANLELLVNRRIIDHACQQKGVTVTDAE